MGIGRDGRASSCGLCEFVFCVCVCVGSPTAQRSAECEGLPPTGGRVMERETRPLALVVLVGPPRGCGGAGSVVVECVVDCDLVLVSLSLLPHQDHGPRPAMKFSRVTRNRAVRAHFATRSCSLGMRFYWGGPTSGSYDAGGARRDHTRVASHTTRARRIVGGRAAVRRMRRCVVWAESRPCVDLWGV